MAKHELKQPVIIIGNARSGTSMLCEMLGVAPGMVEWFEPLTLWRVGTAYRQHERAIASDVRPWAKRHIHRKFLAYQKAHEDRRIVEKSPLNVIRVPFVREVFPEAKLIFTVRDGRAMISSERERYERIKGRKIRVTAGNVKHIYDRLNLMPWWEWPAYISNIVCRAAKRHISRSSAGWWFGVRYPGVEAELERLNVIQRVAKQWAKCAEIAAEDLKDVPEEVCMRVRYEDIVSEPRMWFERMLNHCGMPVEEKYLQHIEDTVFQSSVNRWQTELPPEALAEAMPIMEPQLKRLGYL